jgi:hypothetical protein
MDLAAGSGPAVGVSPFVDGPLNLDRAVALDGRNAFGEGEIGILAPRPAAGVPFARFIPALSEVVMHVDHRGAADFEIDIVVLPFAAMAGRDHGVRVLVDAANESGLAVPASVHQPYLLVLAKAGLRPIPANTQARSPLYERGAMFG